ncbi:MAG: LLM class flavin-dependent oxidoreductase [Haloferacaceae archaeon]
MQLGLHLPNWSSDDSLLSPDRLRGFARRAEELRFRSLWVIDHLTEPPSYNQSWLDPFVTLSHVAAATDRIDLGTGIYILPMREPVLAAKRAATLQHLSGGRFTLGVGLGYVRPDFEAVGVPFSERSPRFTEGLELVTRLLTEERVTFDGEFYSVEDFELEPQLRRPPAMVAAGGGTYRDEDKTHYGTEVDEDRYVPRAVLERIARAGGWIAPGQSVGKSESDIERVNEFLVDEGVDPASVPRYAHNYVHVVPGVDSETAREKQRAVFERYVGDRRPVEFAEENYLFGSVEEIRDQIERYERAGFDQLILGPVAKDPAELDRQLELWADLFGDEYR